VFSVPFEEAKCEQGVKKQVTHKVTLNTAQFKFINFSNMKFFLLTTVAYFVIWLPEIPFLSELYSEKYATITDCAQYGSRLLPGVEGNEVNVGEGGEGKPGLPERVKNEQSMPTKTGTTWGRTRRTNQVGHDEGALA
jgi:hypothetical protein